MAHSGGTPVGIGGWDSAEVQHPRWRKALERLVAPTTPGPERLRLARKLLRDGSDPVACMVMSAFRAGCVEARFGQANPLEPAYAALRVRALRMLRQDSRQQGRDHREALALLAWAPQAPDLPLVLAVLRERRDDVELWATALTIARDLAPFLGPEPRAALSAWAADLDGSDLLPDQRAALSLLRGSA